MSKKQRKRRSKIVSQRSGVGNSKAERVTATSSSNDVQQGSRTRSSHGPADSSLTDLPKRLPKTKSRLATLSVGIPRPGKRFLITTIVIFIVIVLFSDVFQKNVVMIEPFMVNSELQSSYNGQMLSARLLQNINIIIQETNSIKQAQEFSLPLSTRLPDVELPESKISLKAILQYVQQFPPFRYVRRKLGLNPIRVEGDASLHGDVVTIDLRISKDVNGKATVKPKRFSQNLEGNPTRMNSIFMETSEFILEDTEPYLWAVYRYRNNRTDEAFEKIQCCLSQDDTEQPELALILWGLILMDRKQYDEAITKFEAATKSAKDGEKRLVLAAANNNWGLALLYQHRRDAAIAKFEEAIRHDPNHAPTYNNYGKAYLEKNETKKAIEKLDIAVKLDKTFAAAYYNLGYAHWTDSPDEAVLDFKISIRHDPKCAGLDPRCADMYNKIGLLQGTAISPRLHNEAIANLKKAIQMDKESADAWANLGLVWTDKRTSLLAVDGSAAREEAIKAGEESIKALGQAIKLYESQKYAKGGDQDFKAAYSKAYNDLGWAYEQGAEYTTAVEKYSKSFEINPAFYYALTGKGDALRKLGSLGSALAEYERVLHQPEADRESRLAAYKGKAQVFVERCRSCPLAQKRKAIEMSIFMIKEAQKTESQEMVKALEEIINNLDELLEKTK